MEWHSPYDESTRNGNLLIFQLASSDALHICLHILWLSVCLFTCVYVLLSLHNFVIFVCSWYWSSCCYSFEFANYTAANCPQELPATPSCPPPAPPPPLPAACCATRPRPHPTRSRSWAATTGRRYRRRRACMRTGPRKGPAAGNSSY